MLRHHVATFYPDTVGLRSSEHPFTAVLTERSALIESEADLHALTPQRLLRLHNHVNEEQPLKRLAPDTAAVTWARMQHCHPRALRDYVPSPMPDIPQQPEPENENGRSSLLPEKPQRRAILESDTRQPSIAHRVEQQGSSPSRAGGGTSPSARSPRQGGVGPEIRAMLERPEGASKDEILAALGTRGNDNTVRGTISVLGRTQGLTMTKEKDSSRGTIYRLTKSE